MCFVYLLQLDSLEFPLLIGELANHIDPENIQNFVRGNVYSHEAVENKGEEKVDRKSLKGVGVKRKYRIWRFRILEIRN